MELFTKQITTGDLFSVYGTVGYLDYTIRRRLRMSAPVGRPYWAALLMKV